MVGSLTCPVCSESTDASECPSCEADLSPLHEVRIAADRCAREAVSLARHRRVAAAADAAEQGVHLYLDEKLRSLFGWMLFLDGRITAAGRCWDSVPGRAESMLDTFNRALGLARRSSWQDAFDALRTVKLPFRPAHLLEFVCANRLGDQGRVRELRREIATSFPDVRLPAVEARSTQESDSASEQEASPAWSGRVLATTAAAALLMVGLGAGYLIGEGGGETGSSSPPGDEISATPTPEPDPGPPEPSPEPSPSPDSLRMGWAYLLGEPDAVVEEMGATVGPKRIGAVQNVPSRVREQTGRDWYLQGVQLLESGRQGEARPYFEASLASVGSASEVYWVDDALYLLTRLLEEREDGSAPSWARTLLAHHDTSMYANSVIRAIAADTGSVSP